MDTAEHKRAIIIDTDPGQDDAVAILLALASPELEVLGICAVAGNVPLDLTQRNVRMICELAGRPETLVFAGADRPLWRPLVTAEYIHGKTGLDGAELPAPTMPLQAKHAADFIVDTVMDKPNGTVTLCALGPLTNIALALDREPKIAPRIREIVMMGGGFSEGGNVTPAAEFNFYVDPRAARAVFESGIPLVVMPLDVTHKTLTTVARVRAFSDLKTPVCNAVAGLLGFFERYDEEKYGTEGAPLHDPNVIAYLLRPELYKGRHINVRIETESELTMGMSVADWWGVTGEESNAYFVRDVDADGYFRLLTARIGTL